MGRPHLPGVWSLGAAMVLLSAGGLVAARAGVPAVTVALVATAALAVIALACAAAGREELRPLLATGGGLAGLGGAVAAFAAALVVGTAYFRATGALGLAPVARAAPFARAGWPAWSVYALVALAPAVLEEIIFRGYAMARLERALTERDALLAQAALCSLLHLGVVELPANLLFGVLAGVVRRRTGSLYPGMAAHAGWSAILVWDELGG